MYIYISNESLLLGNKRGNLELQATRIWRKQFTKVSFNGQAKVAPRNLFDYEHIWTFRKKTG